MMRKPRGRHGAAALLCLLLMLLPGLGGNLQAQNAEREQALKAACVFNFCQFITWPADMFDGPSSPIVIGVHGSDAFGSVLEAMVRGEIVRGRPIQVQRCRRVEDSLGCHMIFVSSSEPRSAALLRQIQNRRIVSVGENDDFITSGGMIALAAVQNRVRLRINLPAVRAGGVGVSSKLLRLADIVQ